MVITQDTRLDAVARLVGRMQSLDARLTQMQQVMDKLPIEAYFASLRVLVADFIELSRQHMQGYESIYVGWSLDEYRTLLEFNSGDFGGDEEDAERREHFIRLAQSYLSLAPVLIRNLDPVYEATARQILLQLLYGVRISDQRTQEWKDRDIYNCSARVASGWCAEAINYLYEAVTLLADALWKTNNSLPEYARKSSREELFKAVMRDVEVKLAVGDDPLGWAQVGYSIINSRTVYVVNIYVNAPSGNNQQNRPSIVDTLLHEFGHIFNSRLLNRAANDLNNLTLTVDRLRLDALDIADDAMEAFNTRGFNPHRQSDSNSASEIWADMFFYWVKNIYKPNPQGDAYSNWISEVMPSYIAATVQHSIAIKDLIGYNSIPGVVDTDGTNLNVRETPLSGTTMASVAVRSLIDVIGRNEDGTWYAARTSNGYWGWVSAAYVQINIVGSLPVVSQLCLDWLNGKIGSDKAPCANSRGGGIYALQ
jgi:hypothetical protein